ncbi:MAG: 30S ribosomal protein S21 [Verrucomicrobia bacterium]|nr:MAG: 30S ribosomal protein S21 [Verrucomicrobiota bacterium]
MPVEVKTRKGETVDKLLRRLKKKLDREEILVQAKDKRYFKKPSEIKRLKTKELAFTDKLRRRYADM